MSHSVRDHLRLEIDAYDASIRQFIPGYEDMVSVAVDAIAATGPRRVVDLGAGTGALAAELLGRTTETIVELVDVDEEMLNQARSRLSDFAARARFTQGSFTEAIPACDAVMASLSLHHLPTLEAKESLFRRAYAALKTEGILVNADVTMPAHDPERTRAYDAWADHLVSEGIQRDEAFHHFEAWADEDTYFPLEEELRAMASAGFEATCVWQVGVSTVVVARKS